MCFKRAKPKVKKVVYYSTDKDAVVIQNVPHTVVIDYSYPSGNVGVYDIFDMYSTESSSTSVSSTSVSTSVSSTSVSTSMYSL